MGDKDHVPHTPPVMSQKIRVRVVDPSLRKPSPPDARVYFVGLQDGAVIGPKPTLRFGLSNMGVAPAGIEKPNTGHHHVLIDTKLPDLNEPIRATSIICTSGPTDRGDHHASDRVSHAATAARRRRPCPAQPAGHVEADQGAGDPNGTKLGTFGELFCMNEVAKLSGTLLLATGMLAAGHLRRGGTLAAGHRHRGLSVGMGAEGGSDGGRIRRPRRVLRAAHPEACRLVQREWPGGKAGKIEFQISKSVVVVSNQRHAFDRWQALLV